MNNVYDDSHVEHAAAAKFPENYQPNADELKLLAECRVESNVKGGIAALLFGGMSYQSIKSFNLTVHGKYGVYPKVGAACLFGFFLGKVLAIPSCYEKFKHLPNSPLGAYMRRKHEGLGESISLESLSDNSSMGFASTTPSKYMDNNQMNSAIDIDVYNSPSNMDSYTGNELNGPESNDKLLDQNNIEKSTVSYAELRRRNREDYARTDKEKVNSSVNKIPSEQPVRRTYSPIPVEEKNKYGDVWG